MTKPTIRQLEEWLNVLNKENFVLGETYDLLNPQIRHLLAIIGCQMKAMREAGEEMDEITETIEKWRGEVRCGPNTRSR